MVLVPDFLPTDTEGNQKDFVCIPLYGKENGGSNYDRQLG